MDEKKRITGSLVITNGKEEANIPDVPRALLEALYASVTNAKDSLSQRRRLPSILKIDDIEQLVDRLDQWSIPYDPISRKVNISVNLFSPDEFNVGSKRSRYSSLEEFRRELPGKTDQIQSISLNFDFIARNERDGVVTQCELTLELKGSVQRSFYSISDKNQLGGRIFRNSDNWSAQMTIRYSDVIVARGLLGVVDEWYKSLPQRVFPKIGKLRAILHQSEHYEPYDLVFPT
jgi:hypothetical protein